MRNYRRGAEMSQRNEIARRERDAPLLHAAGILTPMPTIDERIEQRQRADAEMGSWLGRVHARSRAHIELYRQTILEQHGAEVLAQVDAELQASHLAKREPAYHADFYCGRLAVLTGWQKLETFERVGVRGCGGFGGSPWSRLRRRSRREPEMSRRSRLEEQHDERFDPDDDDDPFFSEDRTEEDEFGIGEDDDVDYDDPDPEEDLQGLNFMRVEFGR